MYRFAKWAAIYLLVANFSFGLVASACEGEPDLGCENNIGFSSGLAMLWPVWLPYVAGDQAYLLFSGLKPPAGGQDG